jgi:hypothetical protein
VNAIACECAGNSSSGAAQESNPHPLRTKVSLTSIVTPFLTVVSPWTLGGSKPKLVIVVRSRPTTWNRPPDNRTCRGNSTRRPTSWSRSVPGATTSTDRPAAQPIHLDRPASEREPSVQMLVPERLARRAQRLVSTRVVRLERSHVDDDARGDDRPAARLHRPLDDRRPAHHLRRNGKREVLLARAEADDRPGASDHPPAVRQRRSAARGTAVEPQRRWRVSVLEGQVRVAAADADDEQSGQGHGCEPQPAPPFPPHEPEHDRGADVIQESR